MPPLGLATRISEEKADAIWVLSLHETRAEARLAEECVSAKFGIPQTRFIAGQGRLDVTQERLDEFWREFSDNSDRAEAALRAHNRDIRYPFTSRGESRSLTYWRPREIRAVNLVDGMLVLDATVMVDTNGQWNRGATTPIRVGRRGYDDRVWSMTIDPDQTYVGDGIVTHNCQDADAIITAVLLEQDTQIVAVGDRNQQIYEWRGANSAMDAFGGERATLRKSFRFGPAIADYANGWLDAIGAPVDMRLIPSDKLSTVRRRTPVHGPAAGRGAHPHERDRDRRDRHRAGGRHRGRDRGGEEGSGASGAGSGGRGPAGTRVDEAPGAQRVQHLVRRSHTRGI